MKDSYSPKYLPRAHSMKDINYANPDAFCRVSFKPLKVALRNFNYYKVLNEIKAFFGIATNIRSFRATTITARRKGLFKIIGSLFNNYTQRSCAIYKGSMGWYRQKECVNGL